MKEIIRLLRLINFQLMKLSVSYDRSNNFVTKETYEHVVEIINKEIEELS